jgi:hypothetical protein
VPRAPQPTPPRIAPRTTTRRGSWKSRRIRQTIPTDAPMTNRDPRRAPSRTPASRVRRGGWVFGTHRPRRPDGAASQPPRRCLHPRRKSGARIRRARGSANATLRGGFAERAIER